MRILLTLSVLVACGPAARAQDETQPPLGSATGGEPVTVAPVTVAPVEVNGPGLEPAPLMMPPSLPHYYGRGEWQGHGGCGNGHGRGVGCDCGANRRHSACDGATWGCCPRPCNAHLHLWDDYCHESTPWPARSFRLGGPVHDLRCECSRDDRGRTCTSGGCASGCADRASPADGPATLEPRRADEEAGVPMPPSPPREEAPTPMAPMPKQPMSKEPMPKDMNEKTDKDSKKARRVVPGPRHASLLDRLFPWPSSGSR